MSDIDDDESLEYEKVFNFLDRNKRKRIYSNDVIMGLGVLGKICSLEERQKIENGAKYYDLESFIKLCKEKIDYNNIETNLLKFLRSFESRKKPGYVDKEMIFTLIKKYDFDRNIKDKKINELIKEVTNDNNEDFINIESLVKEFLDK